MSQTPMPPSLPAPPPDLAEIQPHILGAGTRLHRIHSRDFAGDVFNPCKGGRSRFAPIHDQHGACIPTLYGASSPHAAVFETVFHDISAHHPVKSVPKHSLQGRSHTILTTVRPLRLAPLRAPELKQWGITRSQIIETEAIAYPQTMQWAAAIHHQFEDMDGIIWTSRQCDPDSCYMMFGTRVRSADFTKSQIIDGDSDTFLSLVHRAGRRAGIVITL